MPRLGDLRLLFRRRKPPERQSQSTFAIPEITIITLQALKESSDAFPPLKSVVGGVVHIWELLQKVKSNRAGCQALGDRTQEILYLIADVVPDATQLSPDLVNRLADFTKTLNDIQVFMEGLQVRLRKRLTRLVHHKEDEATLKDFNQRLDDAYKSFTLVSSIKIEMTVSKIEQQNKDHVVRIDALSDSIKHGYEETMALILQKDERIRMQLRLLVLFD